MQLNNLVFNRFVYFFFKMRIKGCNIVEWNNAEIL